MHLSKKDTIARHKRVRGVKNAAKPHRAAKVAEVLTMMSRRFHVMTQFH